MISTLLVNGRRPVMRQPRAHHRQCRKAFFPVCFVLSEDAAKDLKVRLHDLPQIGGISEIKNILRRVWAEAFLFPL